MCKHNCCCLKCFTVYKDYLTLAKNGLLSNYITDTTKGKFVLHVYFQSQRIKKLVKFEICGMGKL